MTPPQTSSRRQFLADVRTLGVSTALWLTLGCGVNEQGDERIAVLLAIFSDPEATRLVGSEVLKAAPTWKSERGLMRALMSSDAWNADDAPASILTDQIRRDFDEDRVLAVRGWSLSETEARLFALAALHTA